jgi:hypothetical protein
MKLFDSSTDFADNADGLLIKRQQEIPDHFLDQLKDMRHASHSVRENEFMLAASIPVLIHEKWLREGYDCTRAPIKETLARLRRENLEAFIATDKRV